MIVGLVIASYVAFAIIIGVMYASYSGKVTERETELAALQQKYDTDTKLKDGDIAAARQQAEQLQRQWSSAQSQTGLFRSSLDAAALASVKPDAAIQAYDAVLATDPQAGPLYILKSNAQIASGKLPDAIKTLQAGEQGAPTYVGIHYYLAVAYLKAKQQDSALKEVAVLVNADESFRTSLVKDREFSSIAKSSKFLAILHPKPGAPGLEAPGTGGAQANAGGTGGDTPDGQTGQGASGSKTTKGKTGTAKGKKTTGHKGTTSTHHRKKHTT